MRYLKYLICIIIFINLTGCAIKSEFMLRQSKEKKLNLDPSSIKPVARYMEGLILKPSFVSLSKEGINIYIRYLNRKVLENFFDNEKRFGKLAGPNPYFKDVLVFYIRITNNTGGKIKLDPKNFVLLDDLHNQYSYLNPDYIISLYKARSIVYSITKSTQELTPGGIYGAPVDVATSLTGRGLEKKLILLKTVELTGGYVYNGVSYDGLIAFFKPLRDSSKVKLKLPDIKTEFDVNDEALREIEFETSFEIISAKEENN